MANITEISRGTLSKKEEAGFGQAELFWEARTSDEYKNENHKKYNEGTLWIGRPSLNDNSIDEPAIPIAGARVQKSLVYRGEIDDEVGGISNPIFEHAQVGDFWSFGKSKNTLYYERYGYSKNREYAYENLGADPEHDHLNFMKDNSFTFDRFQKGDILLITETPDDSGRTTTWTYQQRCTIKYIKLSTTEMDAGHVFFDSGMWKDGETDDEIRPEKKQQFNSTTVRDALIELQCEKLQFAGEIYTQKDIPASPVIGGLYLVKSDGIQFASVMGAAGAGTANKGDFAIYHGTNYTSSSIDGWSGDNYYHYYCDWEIIHCGYNRAEEINYYPSKSDRQEFVNSLNSTFSQSHKDNFVNSSENVKQALDFLMSNKAQLDESGKVPLSQLHDTVLGALQFKGEWCPLKNENQVTDNGNGTTSASSDNFASLPNYEFETPENGVVEEDSRADYYVVTMNKNIVNLQYKYIEVASNGTREEKTLELNNGDWIVRYKDENDHVSYLKIDNSERLSSLQYKIDSATQDNVHIQDASKSDLTLVGTPILKAGAKIGLMNSGSNSVTIVGKNLVDQKASNEGYEESKENFIPEYDNNSGTIRNSSISTSARTDKERLDELDKLESSAKTTLHDNVQIGELDNTGMAKSNRDLDITGDINIHAKKVVNQSSADSHELSSINFLNKKNSKISLRPSSYDSDINKQDSHTVFLPRFSYDKNSTASSGATDYQSTLLATRKRIAENTVPIADFTGEHLESSSIVEKQSAINIGNNKSVSAKQLESFGLKLGNTNSQRFNDSGTVAGNASTLQRNAASEQNEAFSLPSEGGTLTSQKDIYSLFKETDDTSLPKDREDEIPVFGKKINEGNQKDKMVLNPLVSSPIKLIKGLLKSVLNRRTDSGSISGTEISSVQNSIERTGATADSKDISIKANVVVGDDDFSSGTLLAKQALGVGSENGQTGFIVPQSYSPDTPQARDPLTGNPVDRIDVFVEMPAESGTLLTNNSVIDGGYYV